MAMEKRFNLCSVLKKTKDQPVISENSLKAYVHIYNLLKEIQEMEFKEPEDFVSQLETIAEQAGIPKNRNERREWVWSAFGKISIVQGETLNLGDPFRRVRWLMVKVRSETCLAL
jgi:hypothetical protein